METISQIASLEILKQAILITGFVVVMMLVVEYLNVISSGVWSQRLSSGRWGQYLLAAGLGATPGCLGAFAAVAMYAHGVLSLGAVVATMIATSGDESFVMLALIPKQALLLFSVLFVLAVLIGVFTDTIAGRFGFRLAPECDRLTVHPALACDCFPSSRILSQWRHCTWPRAVLTAALGLILLGVAAGHLGPGNWGWIRVTTLVVTGASLFVVATVPDHFLREHLWEHVVRKHALRVFLWTFAALLVMHLLTDTLHLEQAIRHGRWILLLVACLVGLIPESGPHLIFVTLYAAGAVPFSVLLASSMVQDGHGMLPMLAESRRDFTIVKGINFAAGLLIGAAVMAAGW